MLDIRLNKDDSRAISTAVQEDLLNLANTRLWEMERQTKADARDEERRKEWRAARDEERRARAEIAALIRDQSHIFERIASALERLGMKAFDGKAESK